MQQTDLLAKNFVADKEATIKEVMAAMNDNQRGTVVIIDNNFQLVGVVSDGDIRRALTEGKELFSPVADIVNLNPVVIKESEDKQTEAARIFAKIKDINVLPVVDGNNKLVDIIIRSPEKRK